VSGDPKQVLKKGVVDLGFGLSDDQIASCLLYLAELRKWNQKINLTAIRDERDIIIKHFLDSFSYGKGFLPRCGMSLLDMGSGAGFPALPLKIAFPQINVTLVESVQKKATFLRHIIRTLNLSGAEVKDVRTGDLPVSLDSSFDVVTARAFAAIENAISEGHRFLRPDGVMVLSRGPEETIDDRALIASGMTVASMTDLVLPLSENRRALWVFRKSR
jgi:16S rRNA (guanine527-N7)-methyltransferase